MESLLQDIRYGIRVLRKSPGFTIVAVLALALGIGANSAIFSVVNSVLLQPLPYQDPDGLLRVSISIVRKNVPDLPLSRERFFRMKEQSKSFTELSAYFGDNFALSYGNDPEQLLGCRVSASLFKLIGVKPVLGRDFRSEEDTADGDPVTILSYGLWQRRFAGDPNIVGKPLSINGKGYTVIGVMPTGFSFPVEGFELWVTNTTEIGRLTPQQVVGGATYIFGLGRLKPGVSLQQAKAELDVISQNYQKANPNATDGDPNAEARIITLKEQIVQNVRPTLVVLLAAVGFVLLIACANVANLLLARAVGRQKEISIRTALGASRGRIVRQLLVESLLLSTVGGAAGLLIAYWGVATLSSSNLNNLPRSQTIGINTRVVIFSLVISLLTGIIFGLVPALKASKPDLNETLKDGGRGGTEGLAKNRLRSGLVVVEIALSLVLLIGAGLLIKSFSKLQEAQPGFNTQNILTMAISLPQSKYPVRHSKVVFLDQVLQRIKALPGVKYTSASMSLPLAGSSVAPFMVEGRAPLAIGERPFVDLQSVSTDYFKVMEIPLLAGREFNEHDQESSKVVVIVNNTLAKRYWPDENPLGKTISLGGIQGAEVVGIVGDVRTRGLDADLGPMAYGMSSQVALTNFRLEVKTASDPSTFTRTVTEQILAVDKDQPVTAIQTMDQVAATSVGPQKLAMSMLGIFAVLALLLASVGIYGVMSYSVTQRTQEIGIRMALGAQPQDVLKLVVGHAFWLSAIGVGIGLVAAFGLTRLMSDLLFGVGAKDPLTFLAVSLFLTVIALFASYMPARRAAKVDPIQALKSN